MERLEILKTKMYSVGASQISDMPRAGSPDGDKISRLVVAKDELESEIQQLRDQHNAEHKWIEEIIHTLRKADERTVIRTRYLDGMKWEEVVLLLYADNEDYLNKSESYLRQVHRLHGQALLHMAREVSNRPN